jgi:hypothetical protein
LVILHGGLAITFPGKRENSGRLDETDINMLHLNELA